MASRGARRACWIGVVVVLAGLAGVGLARDARAIPPIPKDTPIRSYIVQPGDSVWSIAEQFYGAGENYAIIYQYNGFTATPPFLLKPGQVLQLPMIGFGPEAEVAWLQREVKAKPPRAVDWLAAREQMSLWRLYRVSTGDASAAHIVFADKSDLRLREHALLVIYGGSASAARTSRPDKNEIELTQGTIVGGLAALDATGQAALTVHTASGQVDCIGKAIQVQAEEAATMVSAFLGAARVAAQGLTVTVQEAQGTVVERGHQPQEPRPLPSAPHWLDADPKDPTKVQGAIVAQLPGRTADWEAAWEAVPRAARYRVELASDEDFHQVLYDVEVGAGVTRVKLAALKTGRYFVRVGTRDERLLESKPAAPRALDVVPIELARAPSISQTGVYEVVGYSRVAAPQGFLLKDSAAPADAKPEGVLRLVTPGPHEVDLYDADGEATAARLRFEVIPVTPRLTAPTPTNPTVPRAPHVDPLKIGIKLVDAKGRLATMPEVVIEQLPDDPADAPIVLPARFLDGVYTTDVAAVPWAGPDTVSLRVSWPGGVLGVATLPVELARPAEDEGVYAWQPAMVAPERGVRGWAQPAPLTPAQSRLGLGLGVGGHDTKSGSVELSLAGEAALGEHLALTGEFGFQSFAFDEDGAGQTHIGDLSLAARWRAAFGPLTLAPYLRLTIPIGRGEVTRMGTLEPGLTARLELMRGLLLDARVAVATASDFADVGTTALAGSAALTWRPGVRASLSLGWETQGMAWATGDVYQSGALTHWAGVGAAFYFGRARFALSAEMGIGKESEQRLGLWLVHAVLDIALGSD